MLRAVSQFLRTILGYWKHVEIEHDISFVLSGYKNYNPEALSNINKLKISVVQAVDTDKENTRFFWMEETYEGDADEKTKNYCSRYDGINAVSNG